MLCNLSWTSMVYM